MNKETELSRNQEEEKSAPVYKYKQNESITIHANHFEQYWRDKIAEEMENAQFSYGLSLIPDDLKDAAHTGWISAKITYISLVKNGCKS